MNQVKTTSGTFTPPQFSEVIFKTSRFAAMKDWYETVTDVKAFFVRDDAKKPNWTGAYNIAFIRIFSDHPYTQVLGIFEVPAVRGQADNQKGEPGMHHMQLRHAGLDHLFSRYETLRAQGIAPMRSFNHGPGTSFYYHDPDGNTVELSSANFVNEADYLAYFRSESYAKNISGIEIDPAAYVARFRAGTPQETLVRF
ncbi:MAG TPA: VOC family protein [Burkholderiales bacterium]|nr:VOC family protein [Burkholderiales bacterium]